MSSMDIAFSELKEVFVDLCTVVEENVRLSTEIYLKEDTAQVSFVKEADKVIDQKEIHLEDACLKFMAKFHPVAKDLRTIVAMIKINNDLERISDLAVNIAKSILLSEPTSDRKAKRLEEIIQKVLVMLQKSIYSCIHLDAALAKEVCRLDDEVDTEKHNIKLWGIACIKEHPDGGAEYIDIIMNARRLERIGDLCTNIAEEVILIEEGEIIRHQQWPQS